MNVVAVKECFINNTDYKNILIHALNEDTLPNGDVTSSSLIPDDHTSTFKLVLNDSAVLAGLEVFKDVFCLVDKNINIDFKFKDGDKIDKNTDIAFVSGKTLAILKGERTALNFISHLSGIATLTREMVELIDGTGVQLLDTRKTTPTLRLLEKQALKIGGAVNHRFNLSEMVLIKDNHIASVGSAREAVLKAKRTFGGRLKIEVEVENIDELKEVIPLNPDIIMFDNWSVLELEEAVKLVPSDILTEASGQITPENIVKYANTGVKYISSSYMVKNAKWVDFSLSAILKNEL